VARVLLLCVIAWLCSGCAPSLRSIYQPFFERHEWVYNVERSGLNASYKNIIRVSSEPVNTTETLIRVHVFPDDKDPSVGARHTYRLLWTGATPVLVALTTQAGTGSLLPGLPLPDFSEAKGGGKASYASGRGDYAGREFQFDWHYIPEPNPFTRRADLELRSSLRITNSNVRLEFKPGVGVGSAEWKTIYGVTVQFQLESFK
jgi:hypothetical protein